MGARDRAGDRATLTAASVARSYPPRLSGSRMWLARLSVRT